MVSDNTYLLWYILLVKWMLSLNGIKLYKYLRHSLQTTVHEQTWQVNYCNIYNLHWKDKLCSLDFVLCTLPASWNQSTTARVEKYS